VATRKEDLVMTYAFIVLHYPRPPYRDDMLKRMQEVEDVIAGVPGFIDAGQWAEDDGDCIAGISMWQTKEAWRTTMDKAATVAIDFGYSEERESRPRQRFGF
jgi:hypothetical protein